jgi:hypothetical protein
MTNFWLRDNLVRDTAPVPIYQISTPGLISSHLATLYRDHAFTQYTLYHDGKNTCPTDAVQAGGLAPGQFPG